MQIKSETRMRALISSNSDDENEEANETQPSHPSSMKLKAPSQDYNIDMQLEDVSPEHGGSSLQLSISQEKFLAGQHQTIASEPRLEAINLAERTPPTPSHKSPRKDGTLDTQSAKRRRSEGGRHMDTSDISKLPNTKTKQTIPSIDIVSQMWRGFSIHEAVASQRGKEIIHEHQINKKFDRRGIPSREIIDFKTLRRAFLRVPQTLYPNERPDAVPSNHLHFTQVPRLKKVNTHTGLEGRLPNYHLF